METCNGVATGMAGERALLTHVCGCSNGFNVYWSLSN